MKLLASITLETLRCHRQSGDSSKPYIWPVLAAVTITGGGGGVSTTGIARGYERAIIKDGMRPGDTASIPAVLRSFARQFDPIPEGSSVDRRAMLLIVALLNAKNTPLHAIEKGAFAFSTELDKQITLATVLAINTAIQAEDEAELDRLVAAIRKDVEDKVTSAIANDLDLPELANTPDKIIGFDFSLIEVTGPAQAPVLVSFSSDDRTRFDRNYVGITLWTRPRNLSAAVVTTPGAPITAVPWLSGFALFATDASGLVNTAGGDPKHGLMGAWAPVSAGFAGVPGAPVTAVPWGPRFALFATDANGVVHTAAGDPQRGLMDAWAPVSAGLVTTPGAPITAVPWGQRFALFATDANGVVYTAGGDPNGLMDAWAPVSDAMVSAPGAPVTAVPWGQRFALFATDSNGVVRTAGGDPNGLMGAWAPISDALVAAPGAPITALPWGPRFALFATSANGGVYTAAGDPQHGLMGAWASVSEGSGMPASRIAAIPYGNRFALFITDPNGGIYTSGGNPQDFGPWSLVTDMRLTPGAPVTAVPYEDGFALFVTGLNGSVYGTSSRFPEYTIVGSFEAREA